MSCPDNVLMGFVTNLTFRKIVLEKIANLNITRYFDLESIYKCWFSFRININILFLPKKENVSEKSFAWRM